MKFRSIAVVGAVLAAVVGGVAVPAAAPSTAQAANQHYWSGSVPSGGVKYTRNPSGTLQYATRTWGSIYNNGGPWANIFTQSNGTSLVQNAQTANPVTWSYNGPFLVATGCANNHHQFTIIANCWTNFI